MLVQSLGFIGAGQMARALAGGWVRAGLVKSAQIRAYDPQPEAAEQFARDLPGALLSPNNDELVRQSDVLFLCVKPQAVSAVLRPLQPSVLKGNAARSLPLFVSIAAGWPLARLQTELPAARWVRVMPNTPCLIGESASAFAAGEGATPADLALVQELLNGVGRAWNLPEKLLDAVTGLSGSGPAYAFLMIEALADGGVRMGLPREIAVALAAQTLRGAAGMVLQTGEHPGALKDRVASPGGTTIAGLYELEARGVRGALSAAVCAATERARELAQS